LRAHFVRDAALRAAEGTLMEAVPIRLKPAVLRAFLEVLSKPAGALPKLSEPLRRKHMGRPRSEEADQIERNRASGGPERR
jgi:uncharacterized protein (DUF1778 family)